MTQSSRGRVRDVLLSAGGSVSAGTPHTYPAPPVANPFASAELIEGRTVEAIAVGDPLPLDDVGFLDGIQRYSVEGWIGMVPVVRGYVAAAILRRESGELRTAASHTEEFIAAPVSRLADRQRDMLGETGLTVYDSATDGERSHPILDVQRIVALVEQRREKAERTVAQRFLEATPNTWLVVDGSITAYEDLLDRAPHLLGLVKSHETQFLEGANLEIALTLAPGYRTSVFARGNRKRAKVYTWYLRLWPWEERDLLHGLVRLERAPKSEAVDEATRVSQWILAERAPLSAPDGRWDRLIYPVRQVETYLRAQAGEW